MKFYYFQDNPCLFNLLAPCIRGRFLRGVLSQYRNLPQIHGAGDLLDVQSGIRALQPPRARPGWQLMGEKAAERKGERKTAARRRLFLVLS